MFGHIFGRFLVEQKMISQQTLEEVLEIQKKVRVKLGLIAVSEKLLSREQADFVTIRTIGRLNGYFTVNQPGDCPDGNWGL